MPEYPSCYPPFLRTFEDQQTFLAAFRANLAQCDRLNPMPPGQGIAPRRTDLFDLPGLPAFHCLFVYLLDYLHAAGWVLVQQNELHTLRQQLAEAQTAAAYWKKVAEDQRRAACKALGGG